MEILKKISY